MVSHPRKGGFRIGGKSLELPVPPTALVDIYYLILHTFLSCRSFVDACRERNINARSWNIADLKSYTADMLRFSSWLPSVGTKKMS